MLSLTREWPIILRRFAASIQGFTSALESLPLVILPAAADTITATGVGLSWGSRGVVAKSVRSKNSAKKHTSPRHGASTVRVRNRPLRDYTEEALQKYFGDLNGHRPGDLYELVLGEVEEPLFKTVLDYTKGNQSVAAEILGINRATLRKKLRHYQLLG